MAYEQKDNRGALFENERKRNNDDADRTGSALIDGRDYWVNGWVKRSKDGKRYLSLSFRLKEQRRDNTRTSRQTPSYQEEMDDEIPF